MKKIRIFLNFFLLPEKENRLFSNIQRSDILFIWRSLAKDGCILKYVMDFFKKYRVQSILAPLFKMLEAIFDLMVPLVVARIINIGIAGQDTGFILLNCGLLVLMDIRHIPTEEDRQMIELAEFCGVPYVVLASKADKIAKSKRQSEAEKLRKHLRTSFSYPIIPVSSKEGIGEARVLEAIREFLSCPAQPPVEEGEEV